MAELLNVKLEEDDRGKFYSFSLSNKPDVVFQCDIEDLESLRGGRYYVHIATKKSKKTYIRTNVDKKHIHFHREILKLGDFNPKSLVDHVDRNTLNCRKYNLRETDYAGNRRNTADCEASYIWGVVGLCTSWIKTRKFFQIYYYRKYVGCAKTEEKLVEKINKLKSSGAFREEDFIL